MRSVPAEMIVEMIEQLRDRGVRARSIGVGSLRVYKYVQSFF